MESCVREVEAATRKPQPSGARHSPSARQIYGRHRAARAAPGPQTARHMSMLTGRPAAPAQGGGTAKTATAAPPGSKLPSGGRRPPADTLNKQSRRVCFAQWPDDTTTLQPDDDDSTHSNVHMNASIRRASIGERQSSAGSLSEGGDPNSMCSKAPGPNRGRVSDRTTTNEGMYAPERTRWKSLWPEQPKAAVLAATNALH